MADQDRRDGAHEDADDISRDNTHLEACDKPRVEAQDDAQLEAQDHAHADSQHDAHLEEVTVRSERLFDGHFLHAVRDIVRLPDGKETDREYILHPGAVMLIPLLADGRVVMERQWRHPLRKVFIEFPAGKIDPGEAPLATCDRELREETGYIAERFTFLTTINNAISYSNEHIDLYLAEGLTAGEQKLDEGEFLDVFAVEPAQVMAWVKDGTITDVKTIIGAFWLEKVTSGAWLPCA